MITPEKIDEWVREVEERSSSAPLLIRYIANRLSELTSRNEELLAENIELRSGKKVEEYMSRISSLEYQLDLLKRQLGGEAVISNEISMLMTQTITTSLLVYDWQGRVLRAELNSASLASGAEVASFQVEMLTGDVPPRLLVAGSQEELLYVFDSGRTVAQPVSQIPVVNPQALDWQSAALQEPRGSEELVTILPVARMTLYDFCIQASRRGYVKKLKESFFETCVANGYVGTGVNLPSDKTCSLVLCTKDEPLVMASKEGYLLTLDANRLPLAIIEALRLGITDHIVTMFAIGKKPSILVVTRNGKAIHRQIDWLEPAGSFKTKGQPIFSKERREAGVRVVGAAPVEEKDWGVVLRSDGKLVTYLMSDVFNTGSVITGQEPAEILGFATFMA